MKKFFTLLLPAFFGMNSIAQICVPLDPNFGNGGKAFGLTVVNGNNSFAESRNIIVQPDNKIIHVLNLRNGNTYSFGFSQRIYLDISQI